MPLQLDRRTLLKASALFAAQPLLPLSTGHAANLSASTITLFDSYAHVISPDQQRYMPNPLGGEKLGANTYEAPMTGEDLISAMNKAGVARACIIHRAFVYGYDCSLVFETARAYPQRFSAVPVINPNDPNIINNIEKWMTQYRIPAIRIMGENHNEAVAWIDQPSTLRVWDASADMGLPVEIELYPSNNIEGLQRITALLEKRPKAKAIIDNLAEVTPSSDNSGFSDPWQRASQLENLAFKVATRNLKQHSTDGRDPAAFIRYAIDLYGSGRIMWGSNINRNSEDYEAMVALAINASAQLTAQEKANFLQLTGESFFWPS